MEKVDEMEGEMRLTWRKSRVCIVRAPRLALLVEPA
jgi:hypothetical protein